MKAAFPDRRKGHSSIFQQYCHVPGFAWLIRRVLDLMVEFIGPIYNWLQQFTNHYLTHCRLLPSEHPTETVLTFNWTALYSSNSDLNYKSKSKSELLYDWRFTTNQFVLALSPLRPTTKFFFNWTLAVIVLMWYPLWLEDGFVWIDPVAELRLSVPSYNSSARTPRETQSLAVKYACLLVCYLAMDVLLLLRAYSSGICLSSRCLAMGICVTVF
jgi:hypothetical protein